MRRSVRGKRLPQDIMDAIAKAYYQADRRHNPLNAQPYTEKGPTSEEFWRALTLVAEYVLQAPSAPFESISRAINTD